MATEIHTLEIPKEEVTYDQEGHDVSFLVKVDGATTNNSFKYEVNVPEEYGDGWLTVIRNMNSIRIVIEANYTTADRFASITFTHNDDASVITSMLITQSARVYGITLSSYEVELQQFPGNGDGTQPQKVPVTVQMKGGGKSGFKVSSITEYDKDGNLLDYDNGINLISTDNFQKNLTILNYGQPFRQAGNYYVITISNRNDKSKTADIKVRYAESVATMMAYSNQDRWRMAVTAYDLEDSFGPFTSECHIPYYGGEETERIDIDNASGGNGWRIEGEVPDWLSVREMISNVLFSTNEINVYPEPRKAHLKVMSTESPYSYQYIEVVQDGYTDLRLEYAEDWDSDSDEEGAIRFYPKGNTMNTMDYPARKSVKVRAYGGHVKDFDVLLDGKEVAFKDSVAYFSNGIIRVSKQLTGIGSLYNEYTITITVNREMADTKEFLFNLRHKSDNSKTEELYVAALGKASVNSVIKTSYDLTDPFPSEGLQIKDIQVYARFSLYNGINEEVYENCPITADATANNFLTFSVHDGNLLDISIAPNRTHISRGCFLNIYNKDNPKQMLKIDLKQEA